MMWGLAYGDGLIVAWLHRQAHAGLDHELNKPHCCILNIISVLVSRSALTNDFARVCFDLSGISSPCHSRSSKQERNTMNRCDHYAFVAARQYEPRG